MHAELRWFVSHTLQRRSPQPGDRGRYREDKNALATRTSVSDHQLHTRCSDCGRYHDHPRQEMGATKNVRGTDDHVVRLVHSVMYRRHLNC